MFTIGRNLTKFWQKNKFQFFFRHGVEEGSAEQNEKTQQMLAMVFFYRIWQLGDVELSVGTWSPGGGLEAKKSKYVTFIPLKNSLTTNFCHVLLCIVSAILR